jgi:hypothetical protein
MFAQHWMSQDHADTTASALVGHFKPGRQASR